MKQKYFQMRGPVTINWLSERADLIHYLAHQKLSVRRTFFAQKTVQPTLYGLSAGFTLPRADWSPVTQDGQVLAYGLSIDAKSITSILGGDPTGSNFSLRVDDPVKVHSDQRVIIIGTSDNWYHFILDYLPRLLAVLEYGLIADGWSIALGVGQAQFFRGVTELLGIPGDQVIWLEDNQAHYFPRALHISNFNHGEGYLHPLTLTLLRSSLLKYLPRNEVASGDRVFVSRIKSGRRRLINEFELYSGLKERGFLIVHSETLSLIEQVNVFRSARNIAGVHGAGLANAIWCEPIDRIFEISYAPLGPGIATHDPHFKRLMQTLGGQHRFIRATENQTVSPGDHFGGFWIDPERFFNECDKFFNDKKKKT